MKRSIYILSSAGVLILFTTSLLVRSRERSTKAAPKAAFSREGLIAAPGRVEAISEEIRVSSELSGRLHSVAVEEGESVHRGQVLAQLENEDYIARVAEAEAALAQRRAEWERTINGARSQERQAAKATLEAAKAVVENAKREADRRRMLAQHQTISRDEAERYDRAYRVAQAEYERAEQEFSLVDAEAREEDRRKAEAAVRSAEAQLAEARAYLEKTYIRCPLDGVV